MHILSKKAIIEFWVQHADAEGPLKAWYSHRFIELPLNICADRANHLPQRAQRSPSVFSEHSVYSVACFGCGWKPRYEDIVRKANEH